MILAIIIFITDIAAPPLIIFDISLAFSFHILLFSQQLLADSYGQPADTPLALPLLRQSHATAGYAAS